VRQVEESVLAQVGALNASRLQLEAARAVPLGAYRTI
jgi:hypothetical protein